MGNGHEQLVLAVLLRSVPLSTDSSSDVSHEMEHKWLAIEFNFLGLNLHNY